VRRIPVDPARPEAEAAAEAVRVLAKGGLVALPTETVYGLCADADNPAAIRRLYAIKGRDPRQACALLLPNAEAAQTHAKDLPKPARRIIENLWPGPITLVVAGNEGKLVGLRLPKTPLAREIALAYPGPLFLTSANRSGQPAALNAAGVAEALGDQVDLLLDGGRTPGGRSSTVVRCDEKRFTLLRDGALSRADLLRAATDLVLTVCTGNICRSPTAAAMLRRDLCDLLACEPRHLAAHGYRLGSFGTMAQDGRSAPQEAVAIAEEHGVDITKHSSRPFSIELVKQASRVYWMSGSHRDFLSPFAQDRPDLLQSMDPRGRDVPDPYGRSRKTYKKVAELLESACRIRAEELVGPDQGPVASVD